MVSSGYMAFILGYAISAVFSGRFADRYNPRFLLLASAVLSGLGISLCSQIDNVDQLRLFFFIAGIGAGPTWSLPTATTQRWFFEKHRAGIALSIVSAGVGVGSIIFAPLINYLILSYGWRTAYLVVGILFFIIIALASFVIKQSPPAIETVTERGKGISASAATRSYSTAKAITSLSFITIVFTICVANIAFQVVSVHLVPHATDVGISATAAAAALGFMGGFSVPGRILSGMISDKIGWQKTMAISLFTTGLSIVCLIFLKDEWLLYFFVFLYGMSHGARITSWVGVLGEFYGLLAVGEILGINQAISQFVGAFAPYIAGFIFDITKSYSIVFIVVIVLLFSASLAAFLIKKPINTL